MKYAARWSKTRRGATTYGGRKVTVEIDAKTSSSESEDQQRRN